MSDKQFLFQESPFSIQGQDTVLSNQFQNIQSNQRPLGFATQQVPLHNSSPQPIPSPIASQPQTIFLRHVPNVEPFPFRTICNFCNQEVVTSTYSVPGLLTYLLSGACCALGCFLGCCLLPFFVESCKNVTHTCPNCNAKLAVFKRIQV